MMRQAHSKRISPQLLLSFIVAFFRNSCSAFSPLVPTIFGVNKGGRHTILPLRSAAASFPSAQDGNAIYDVAIIGSGPASCSLAALLTASTTTQPRPKVALISKYADKRWVPNYGCWTEEWKQLDRLYRERGVSGLWEQGVDIEWHDTDCFLGGKEDPEQRMPIGRAYVRLSRQGLKRIFYEHANDKYDVIKDDVMGEAVSTNVFSPAQSIVCQPDHTELTLKCTEQTVRARIVVDGTGAESPFTIRENRDKEGYQIAYGAECRVTGKGITDAFVGDYDRSKMTLFDYRTSPFETNNGSHPNSKPNKYQQEPTFNYVMPLSKDVIFFEETSLVANPAMSFQECKERMTQRLDSQGITITEVVEEEFCYIPMGGGLPRPGQRIVPIGAAAGIVHASTGFSIARSLANNLDVAERILKELETLNNEQTFDPDGASARIIARTWTPESIGRRNFAVLGGDFFMTLTADELKPFFAGFFELDTALWGSFLSGWNHLPGVELQDSWWSRLWFGIQALTKLPPMIALNMSLFIFRYLLSSDGQQTVDMLQSVTPFAGQARPYDCSLNFREQRGGDLTAKQEALALLCACDRCEDEEERRAKGLTGEDEVVSSS